MDEPTTENTAAENSGAPDWSLERVLNAADPPAELMKIQEEQAAAHPMPPAGFYAAADRAPEMLESAPTVDESAPIGPLQEARQMLEDGREGSILETRRLIALFDRILVGLGA